MHPYADEVVKDLSLRPILRRIPVSDQRIALLSLPHQEDGTRTRTQKKLWGSLPTVHPPGLPGFGPTSHTGMIM